jgi:phosphonoacetaldehyde hydrolase
VIHRLEAVIFDWAGTTVDYGSLAPVRVLVEVFAAHGVPITGAQARRDMGLLKRDHIERILQSPEVSEQWERRYGRAPACADLDELFAEFIPAQMECLAEHSRLIPHTVELTARLRTRGLKIGSTTGYTRPMLDLLLEYARAQGYSPDLSLCPDDVGGGRPKPWMCYRLGMEFRLSAGSSCVKIGDTPADIHEGRNAGMWTLAVAATGNEIGLSEEEFAALSSEERTRQVAAARSCLLAAGAHYVVESVADCEGVLDEIERRIGDGDRP